MAKPKYRTKAKSPSSMHLAAAQYLFCHKFAWLPDQLQFGNLFGVVGYSVAEQF